MRRIKCRESFSLNTILGFLIILAEKTLSGPILGILISSWLPATMTGCSTPEGIASGESSLTTIRMMESVSKTLPESGTLDILIFNDDAHQMLDTYQAVRQTGCSTIKVSSTSGEKIFTILANSRRSKEDWMRFNSREVLMEECAYLEDERRDSLTMSGELRGRAGTPSNVYMQRICSEIVLRSLRFELEEESMKNKMLTDVKVYLTNVNAEAPMISETPFIPRRLLNAGKLREEDMEQMSEPDLLSKEIERAIGADRIYPDIRFLCYPNEVEEEGTGAPFTRLVIEGKIDGIIYWWPLNINRGEGGRGISRNTQYIFDIDIRNPGHNDPDIPVELSESEIIMEVKEWEEREEYGVRF